MILKKIFLLCSIRVFKSKLVDYSNEAYKLEKGLFRFIITNLENFNLILFKSRVWLKIIFVFWYRQLTYFIVFN